MTASLSLSTGHGIGRHIRRVATTWFLLRFPQYCACATDRASQHGPYYQLSWKEKGKTVSRRLPAEHATLYRQWIANRQRLQSIIQQMHGVSQKAHRHLLPAEKTKKGSAKPGDIPSSPR